MQMPFDKNCPTTTQKQFLVASCDCKIKKEKQI